MRHSLHWVSSALKVINKKGKEKGIVANRFIRKGTLLTVFGGYVFTLKEEQKLPEGMRDYALQISNDLVIGRIHRKEESIAEYYNHSCDPNAGFKGQIFLVAMRNIKKGEDVCFDYAMVLSAKIPPYPIRCYCGTKKCRKILSYDDWKSPLLQKRYKDYMQPYLIEKIKKLNHKYQNSRT